MSDIEITVSFDTTSHQFTFSGMQTCTEGPKTVDCLKIAYGSGEQQIHLHRDSAQQNDWSFQAFSVIGAGQGENAWQTLPVGTGTKTLWSGPEGYLKVGEVSGDKIKLYNNNTNDGDQDIVIRFQVTADAGGTQWTSHDPQIIDEKQPDE